MSFDSVLNTIIPPVVIIVFLFIFYKALNKNQAMDTMFRAIGRGLRWFFMKITGQSDDEDIIRNEYTEVVFK